MCDGMTDLSSWCSENPRLTTNYPVSPPPCGTLCVKLRPVKAKCLARQIFSEPARSLLTRAANRADRCVLLRGRGTKSCMRGHAPAALPARPALSRRSLRPSLASRLLHGAPVWQLFAPRPPAVRMIPFAPRSAQRAKRCENVDVSCTPAVQAEVGREPLRGRYEIAGEPGMAAAISF